MRRLNLVFWALLSAAAFCITASAGEGLPAKKDTLNGVTITVTPRELAGPTWEFQVVLETHSQDLKDDLVKSATLLTGGQKIAPIAWQGDPPGGHHRKGVLRFDAPAKTPSGLELHIARPGESKPRVLRWEIQ